MFCGVFRDIFPLRRWFLHVLWRFSGHFLSAVNVSPGKYLLSGTFSFTEKVCPGFSAEMRMFCCWERFPPRFVAFSGTFFFCGECFSWKIPFFRDIFPLEPHRSAGGGPVGTVQKKLPGNHPGAVLLFKICLLTI